MLLVSGFFFAEAVTIQGAYDGSNNSKAINSGHELSNLSQTESFGGEGAHIENSEWLSLS